MLQEFIDEFRLRGWKSNPDELIGQLIDTNSPKLLKLVGMILDQLPTSGTFFEDALSYVPLEEFHDLAGRAQRALEQGGPQETAESFLAHCSLLCVEALHPRLRVLYRLRPNWESYFFSWPWRFADPAEVEGLDPEDQDDLRIMLQTRNPQVLTRCSNPDELFQVGFSEAHQQLYSDESYHLVFPADYWHDEAVPDHLRKRHPTWTGAFAVEVPFGGPGTHRCAVCAEPGQHLITLDSRRRLETCLACLGDSVSELFYAHDDRGMPVPTGYDGPRTKPQQPASSLNPTSVGLSPSERRWQWQDWALSNSRQNLHRLGGHPTWVQQAKYLSCPLCQQRMQALLQLDSYLPCGESEVLWGSGGMLYLQWCEKCRVSGCFWQCT